MGLAATGTDAGREASGPILGPCFVGCGPSRPLNGLNRPMRKTLVCYQHIDVPFANMRGLKGNHQCQLLRVPPRLPAPSTQSLHFLLVARLRVNRSFVYPPPPVGGEGTPTLRTRRRTIPVTSSRCHAGSFAVSEHFASSCFIKKSRQN